MAEAREFPREWIAQVNDMFINKKSLANVDAIPRVATPLMNLKREAYIPHFLSLGPYHHWKLHTDFESSSVGGGCYQYPELKMSTAEAYKVQSATLLWDKEGKSLDDIVKNIEKMKEEIERFYDCTIISRENRYFKDFALMMTIDAYFLLSFLFRLSSKDRDMVSLSTLDVCIKCDILKLENQIPLSVLQKVFENQQSQADNHDFNRLLVEASKELCPFDFIERANSNQIEIANERQIEMANERQIEIANERQIANERHLLGCMHKFVSPFLKMQASRTDDGVAQASQTDDGVAQASRTDDWVARLTLFLQSTNYILEVVIAAVLKIFVKHPTDNDQRDFHNAYNAGQMVKAGIKFKSFANLTDQIRFDTYSGTLYLPRITVSHMQTEVFLRNMMALEFNDANGRNQVTRYVGLMDCIIDTAEDVRLLRDCHVIRRGSLVLTDEWIAKMWNDLRHPFFTGELEPHDDLKDALEEVLIRKYYKSRLKKVLWELYWEHLSKPGKGIALLVGILILAMTVVQTYCSIYGLRHNH